MNQSNRLAVLAHEINTAHTNAQQHAQKSVESAISAGEALLEAKEQLKHGEWLPWLRDNCKVSERSARVYIRLAKHKDEVLKSADAADLTIRGALDAIDADPLAEHARVINEASEGTWETSTELADLFDEVRQSFKGDDNAFKAWLAQGPSAIAPLPEEAVKCITAILELPPQERGAAMHDAFLNAMLRLVEEGGEH